MTRRQPMYAPARSSWVACAVFAVVRTYPPPMSTLTPRSSVIAAGEAAPDFSLETTARDKWTLSAALKKGDVVLSFFPFAFTGVCGTENQCLSKEVEQFAGKHATAVGVSCDSPFALKAWAEQMGFKHTLLSDQHREVAKAYGLYWPEMNTAARGTVIIGQNGKVKWSQKREIPKAFNMDEILAKIS